MNEPTWTFCVRCGASLDRATVVERPPATPIARRAATPETKTWEELWWAPGTQRRKQIDRTATGLTLLIIVLLVSWIPFLRGNLGIELLFAVATIAGAVLVILGRHGFGDAHARNVIVAFALWTVGAVLAFWYFVSVVATVLAVASYGGAPDPGAVLASFDGALVLGGVAAFIGGLAWTLLGYALQRPVGRGLLWAALVAHIALFALGAVFLREVVASYLAGGAEPAQVALSAANGILVLGVIPNAMFASAYGLAVRRINRREIPQPPSRAPFAGLPPKAAFRECPSCRMALNPEATDCFMCGHRFAAA